MKQHLVHFLSETPAFLCFAEDAEHAIEQAENAYPDEKPYSVFILELVWHISDYRET